MQETYTPLTASEQAGCSTGVEEATEPKEQAMSRTATAVFPVVETDWANRWLPGAGNIFRKELLEWFRTRRFWITVALAIAVMMLIQTGVWIVDHDGLTAGRVSLSASEADDARGSGPGTLLSLSSYLAIILTMGMLVREREAGTAQWVFTKPVSRLGYGLAKWAANSVGVVLATVLVPGTLALVSISAMYDMPGWSWADQGLASGLAGVHASIVVALMLALGTFFRSVVPVAVTGLGLSVAPPVLAPLIGSGTQRILPVFGLRDLVSDVANGRALGAGDLLPLIAGLVFLPLVLSFAGYRLSREQLQ
jgi:ABC-2 type transport system permease protein